jgi:uncharacterized protein (DUF2141 family)
MNADRRSSNHSSKIHREGITQMVMVLSLAIPLAGRAADPLHAPADLIIEASGFRSSVGHAVAKLFLPGDNVRHTGRQEVSATIQAGKAALVFHAVPAGEYAVVVFHDINDNGTIDHNLLGIPSETLGFSNGFKLSLTSGLPTFDKLRFTHRDVPQTVSLAVK